MTTKYIIQSKQTGEYIVGVWHQTVNWSEFKKLARVFDYMTTAIAFACMHLPKGSYEICLLDGTSVDLMPVADHAATTKAG